VRPRGRYYAIATGELDAEQDGRLLRRCVRGDGVGEIALLRSIPRTATIVAHTAATVFRLDREPFLTAVLGHAPTHRQAASIAAARLAAGPSPPVTGAAGAGPEEPG
jgi:CRP-like cAMP-binding protein